MVEITKRILICVVAVATSLATLSAQVNVSFADRQLKQLALRSERVASQIEQTKQIYDSAPNDSLAVVLHELGRQAESIAEAIARIEATIAKAEEDAKAAEEAKVAEQQSDEVAKGLSHTFITALKRYTLTERDIENAYKEYATHHAAIQQSIEDFDNATNLADAQKAREAYNTANTAMLATATTIADRSDQLFTSKSKALIWFADSLRMTDEKAYFVEQNDQIEATFMEELRGKCTDLDVAMYPYRKAALMNLEIKLARRMCGEKCADSLIAEMAKINPEEALFAPVGKLKWAAAKYGEVAIHKQNKYSGTGNIPRIKIPAEGEIYAILLGNYASLPSINTFRKAAPLYSERRADGRTYIYAGLYPTAKSAQQGLETLRNAGFKQPTLVMWQNGLRRDDFVDRTGSATAPKAAMYKIEIRGANYGLSEAVSAVIKTKAPRKEISKFTTEVGAIVYTIGIFTKESEADTLAKAIGAADSAVSVRVTKM